MTPVRYCRLGSFALTVLLCASSVWADGPSRPATPAEQAYYTTHMQAFQAALPPAPEGWETGDGTRIQTPERVGEGVEEGPPLSLGYFVEWRDTSRLQAAEANREARLLKKASQARPAGEEERLARFEKLTAELGQAFDQGDMLQAQQLQKEIERYAETLEGGFQEDDAQHLRLMRETSPHDVRAIVRMRANHFSEGFTGEPRVLAPVGGSTLTVRTAGDYSSQGEGEEGTTYVFLGKGWQVRHDEGSTSVEAEAPEGLPHTTLCTLVVTVQADEARARQLCDRIDWGGMQALLRK